MTEADFHFIRERFPELSLVSSEKVLTLEGSLVFRAVFSGDTYHLLETNASLPSHIDVKFDIRDSYSIKIDFSPGKNPFEEVFNTDGRILERSMRLGMDCRDLHVYSEGLDKNKVCVCGPLDQDQNIAFRDFLCATIAPFFYDQSFHELYGYWPKGEYSHGVVGLLENYYDKLSVGYEKKEELTNKCVDILRKYKISSSLISIKGHAKGHRTDLFEGGAKLRDYKGGKFYKGLRLLYESAKQYKITF